MAANRLTSGFEDHYWSGGNLDELHDDEGARPEHPIAAVFAVGMAEIRRGGHHDQAAALMGVAVQRQMEVLAAGLVALRCTTTAGLFLGTTGLIVATATPQFWPLAAGAAVVGMAAWLGAIVCTAALDRLQARLRGFVVELTALLARADAQPAAVRTLRAGRRTGRAVRSADGGRVGATQADAR